MQATLQLSLSTLSWAAASNGYSLPEFAHFLYKTERTAESIAKGQLTLDQVKKFSEKAKVPFGFLFLETPPQDYKLDSKFIDFRTVKNQIPLSANFIKTLRDIEHKQTWYRNYLISIDADKLSFVGKYSNQKNTSNETIAIDIRNTLKLNELHKTNVEGYFSLLSQACENAGILIFKNSVTINATKKPLDVDEFRGFVTVDDYAPCIFINGADSKNANIFTLAHELAHIWLGESGISDTSVDTNNNSEAKCNAIAALILVPTEEFEKLWSISEGSLREKIRALNKYFQVSELVIARTALTHKKIDRNLYNIVCEETTAAWKILKEKNKKKESAVPPSIIVPIRNSKTITAKILELVRNNKMMPSEASVLLNKSAATIGDL